MTTEELKQIYHLNKEVKMWQKELEKIQCKSLIKRQEITGMPFGGGTSDKVSDTAVTICDIETIIKGKLAEIQLARKKIIEYINTIDDSYMRQIVFYRNVGCMRWEDIADEIGGSSGSIKMSYFRFLNKKCYTCYVCIRYYGSIERNHLEHPRGCSFCLEERWVILWAG